ncbi:MAG: hypothetical protein NTV01_12120 [Bacteroidia bacterium]|nr:hypothetical protein [Bacteroidia bacterium]
MRPFINCNCYCTCGDHFNVYNTTTGLNFCRPDGWQETMNAGTAKIIKKRKINQTRGFISGIQIEGELRNNNLRID